MAGGKKDDLEHVDRITANTYLIWLKDAFNQASKDLPLYGKCLDPKKWEEFVIQFDQKTVDFTKMVRGTCGAGRASDILLDWMDKLGDELGLDPYFIDPEHIRWIIVNISKAYLRAVKDDGAKDKQLLHDATLQAMGKNTLLHERTFSVKKGRKKKEDDMWGTTKQNSESESET